MEFFWFQPKIEETRMPQLRKVLATKCNFMNYGAFGIACPTLIVWETLAHYVLGFPLLSSTAGKWQGLRREQIRNHYKPQSGAN